MNGNLDEAQEWYEEGNITDPEESEVHRGPDRGKIIRELREENQRLREQNQRLRSLVEDARRCFGAWKAGKWDHEGKDPRDLTNEFLNRIEQALEETE